jgi:serine/threonine-protein kinase
VIYGLREEVREARRLGQYTLEEKLGEGGMGTVYRARHSMLRRPTAIKLLPPEKAGRAALERFEREVQLTARLSHPNTVAVFDYGRTPDGVFYYAMEYLEGANLDTLVREDGPQPPARVVHVLRQVAAALAEAHGVGLIHRDVKPENVILCERGGVPDVAKVVDFGLVRDLERTTSASSTNLVQGTPLYLSPEAIKAPDRVDGRSDLYALGAVGYFLLTGQHVFTGATMVEVCSHHLYSPPQPPSSRLGRPLPAPLEALVLECLEKDPKRRPASALALRDRLAALAEGLPWSEASARAWWDVWRARPERQRPPKDSLPGRLSVSMLGRSAGEPAR